MAAIGPLALGKDSTVVRAAVSDLRARIETNLSDPLWVEQNKKETATELTFSIPLNVRLNAGEITHLTAGWLAAGWTSVSATNSQTHVTGKFTLTYQIPQD